MASEFFCQTQFDVTYCRCSDTQHNDTQYNDAKHNNKNVTLIITKLNAECRLCWVRNFGCFAVCRYSECRYAECHVVIWA